MAVRYVVPRHWISYNHAAIQTALLEAKAAVLALTQIPYQRSWADQLQQVQLKREVAGTSRIEGAEFTERELEAAMHETPEQLETRSQKQAAAAAATYQWIGHLPDDRPVDEALIAEVHRRLVTGCDDDHCPPGQMRKRDENVTFGAPRHRGVEGGEDCEVALKALVEALRTVYQDHDPIVQALAVHYHFAAMHPFLDGNGRTARALEALMLQRTGLRDTLFIAMSNYYYENKTGYLNALVDTRAADHDLTAFLKFALKGVQSQCRSLFREIRTHVAKALYRNTMTDLFGRLQSPRRRVLSSRHFQLASLVLEAGDITAADLAVKSQHLYAVRNFLKALSRDLNYLVALGALHVRVERDDSRVLTANLEWPTQITETEFFRLVKELPKGKLHGFLSR